MPTIDEQIRELHHLRGVIANSMIENEALHRENHELRLKLDEAKKLIDDVISTCNYILDELKR